MLDFLAQSLGMALGDLIILAAMYVLGWRIVRKEDVSKKRSD